MNLPKYISLTTVLVTILVTGCATQSQIKQSSVNIQQAISFSEVNDTVSILNERHGADNVLIVLDIDNTVLTSSVDLGGDIWYQWQTGKLDVKPAVAQKVKCLFEDSIGLLYELNPMVLTEKEVPSMIESWQYNGNTVFALTSRAPKYRAATERELLNKNINFEKSALSSIGKEPPTLRLVTERELSYMKGIMMTSGMNKGEMLQYLLDRTQRDFDAIVFVDDSKKNVDNVFAQYTNTDNVEMIIFHYTKIESERIGQYGAVLTDQQAELMGEKWKTLNDTLNEIFPARDLGDRCLSVE